jgi:hypothetical protein
MSLIQEALKRKQDGPPPSGGDLTSKDLTKGQVITRGASSQDALPLVAILIGGASLVLILILMTFLFWPDSDSPEMIAGVQAPAEIGPVVGVPLKTGLQASPPPPVRDLQSAPSLVSTPPPAPVPQPPPVVKKSSWPTLKVMGVLTNPESDSDSVIINGQIRDPGERIAGVHILRVETKGVLFRFNGETQFVKVGRSYPD